MPGEFDPVRAQREIVRGAEENYNTVRMLSRAAERKHAEAEAARNALAKVEAATKADLDTKRDHLNQLIWNAENAARGTS